MKRRDLLKCAVALSLPGAPALAAARRATGARVRPGAPGWPSERDWQGLQRASGGQLLKLEPAFAACAADPRGGACAGLLGQIGNPYFIGDQPALTQTSGWIDAWSSRNSAYALAATSAADVAAAVSFARAHRLRLVVKGGGHSYLGTSNAPDSLLVWTRAMNAAIVHDDFVAQGCAGTAPQPAVTLGAGAMWSDAYAAVTTRGGRYVQGGGCTTVGVAGLVQSGGFGSFSKHYGSAAAGLLEAQIVTADGAVRIANACTNADLFWAIKGGGGGSLGVVTRVTLRTHPLPVFFGAVFGDIRASSDSAYRALIAKALAFYQSALLNPHWGEQMAFRSDNVLHLSMVFHDLSQAQAQAVWAPFIEWVGASTEYTFSAPLKIVALPARHFWDGAWFARNAPGLLVTDERAQASPDHVVWAGDKEQAGWFIHSYKSAWLPQQLLERARQDALADALFAASRHWSVALHFNKGLAGAPPAALEATRDTAMNPAVLDAFALAIIAGGGAPAYPGMPGGAHDPAKARADARSIGLAMAALSAVAPGAGAYVSESDYFQPDWQRAYWGSNYRRLAAVKRRYDPDGLFIVHHGVGSEAWSADGFTPLGAAG
ncbi:MAG: FAD-binding oxidoreductase [Pseudomonadota bacterium]|nr:FAD-binding oxidoreductase [Pseudomonadota bacterium]